MPRKSREERDAERVRAMFLEVKEHAEDEGIPLDDDAAEFLDAVLRDPAWFVETSRALVADLVEANGPRRPQSEATNATFAALIYTYIVPITAAKGFRRKGAKFIYRGGEPRVLPFLQVQRARYDG